MNNTQLATYDCSSFDFSNGDMPTCMNFTNCLYENIVFSLHLSEELYKESFIIIQNFDNSTELVL
jgi:hypothetical protein